MKVAVFQAMRRTVWLPLMIGAVLLGLTQSPAASDRGERSARQAAVEDLLERIRGPRLGLGDFLAGQVAQRTGDLSSAAEFMQRALAHAPEHRELLVDTFMLAGADGRLEEALELAERIERLGLELPFAAMLLAAESARGGDYAAADARLARVPPQGVARISLPLLRAWTKAGIGEEMAAFDALEPLRAETGFAPLIELHEALIFQVLGQEEAAAEAFADLTGDDRRPSLRVVWLAGNFFESTGRQEAADALYARFEESQQDPLLVERRPGRARNGEVPRFLVADAAAGMAQALFDIASLLAQERVEEFALFYAHLALHLDPQMESAIVVIGEILQQRQRHRAAIDTYRRVPLDSPLSWTLRQRVAEELERLGRLEESLLELAALAEERPERFEPWYRKGNLLRAHERFDEAVEAYDRAIALLDEPGPQHWTLFYFRGIALERTDQWDRAEADFLRALELEPEQPYVMNYLAYSWVEQEHNLDEAERMLIRAVEQRPDDGYIVDSLGWVYYRLGDFDSAVSYLERAVELRPQDPVINDHLGDAYWRTGRKREAEVQWRRALSLDPDEEDAAIIREKLEHGLAPLERSI